MRVALLGATGAVGQTMLKVLEERDFPITELLPLASERSRGQKIHWRGRAWEVAVPEPGIFRGCTVALFSAGASRSREWAPVAAAEGAVVIDNSSAWRLDPEVPLVVPEVNGHRIAQRPRGVIANPNCVTIQVVVALEALRRAAALRRVVVSSYQAVSGAGQKGLDALAAERAGASSPASPFAAPIDRNVIPLIGVRDEDGWTEEEEKLRYESRKILELPTLEMAATCVRVPVEVGHSAAVMAEFERPFPLAEAREALRAMPGVLLAEEQPPHPRDGAGSDLVRVGRLRVDRDHPNTLHFWVVADNLRKGAATNAVQIAESLARG